MIIKTFGRQNLSRQFLIASFPIFLLGILMIGKWVGMQVENGVVNRIGAITGLYVDSFVMKHVQTLIHADDLAEKDRQALQSLLANTPLGSRIVSFKIWRRDGTVLYSTDKAVIGRSFPFSTGLTTAFAGNYHSAITDLSEEEHEPELQKWPRLIESYVPLRGEGLGKVIAVAEFYQTTDELDREARSAQLKSWFVVAATLSVIYLLLFGLVHRGSELIERQRQDLNGKVLELTALNTQNEQLHDRVRRAAARATALHETFLLRISADLHDGPGQDLGLALMQIDSVRTCQTRCPNARPGELAEEIEVSTIRSSLQSALADLRAIATGLRLPDIAGLSVNQVAARAVHDYERKTTVKVALAVTEEDIAASLPVKITLYRLLQEALANGFRHAGGRAQRIEIARQEENVIVEVSDNGAGFNPHKPFKEGHLGLTGMRERVEVLGGTFALRSAAGQGSIIRICLPLFVPGTNHE